MFSVKKKTFNQESFKEILKGGGFRIPAVFYTPMSLFHNTPQVMQ